MNRIKIIIIICIILITSVCIQNKENIISHQIKNLFNKEKNNKLSVQKLTKDENKSKTNYQLTSEDREKLEQLLEQLEKEIREKQNQEKYEYHKANMPEKENSN
ncbi:MULTISPECIES: hypothetical protein [Caloranaerobacter]|uniref:Uncharacterized protein n=1 Tax=Caloranaerobacter azorensis TaxID=116090 RepID=A0A6P1YC84_9FIRM|nr:hypothetical protein [Caloranaerobacter azorensis]QIB26980.1 hypothetical protein G3A45_06550 [Caloranaerobacter azorensis]